MLSPRLACDRDGAVSIDTAQERILALAPTVTAERVALADAFDRYLTEDVLALRAQPPFASAAMDGWAVAGIEAGLCRIVGESRAGNGFPGHLLPGHAISISTGACLPGGAMRVVRREQAIQHGRLVEVLAGVANADVRAFGSDFTEGALLARRGDRIDPLCIARMAAGGHAKVPVAGRPSVAILATGDEVVPPGASPRADQIFDSLSLPIQLRVCQAGGRCAEPAHVHDDTDAFAAAIESIEYCCATDIFVVIGGASGGRHDHTRMMLAQRGFECVVQSVLVKPGKPFWCGYNAQGQVAIGLPGNPVAALACVELFLLPLIRAWQGGVPLPGRFNVLAEADPSPTLERVLFARSVRDATGRVRAELLGGRDSAALSPLSGADLLVRPARGEAIPL